VRPDREQERKNAIRRDLILAGAAVAAFVSLGAFLTFMSGDAARMFQSVAAVVFDRPAPKLGAAQPETAARPEVKGCKYCVTLRKIQTDFAVKAKRAQDLQDAAFKATRGGSAAKDGTKPQAGASQADLAAATDSFERHSAAAKALEPFLAACEQESFCKPGFTAVKAGQACAESVDDAGLRGPAVGMAAVARDAAMACISQACPAVDCAAVGDLRQDLVEAAEAMAAVGAPVAVSKGQPRLTDLQVGAATLDSEISKAIREVEYVAKLYPSLIERPEETKLERAAQMPAMVGTLATRQTEMLRSVADVMAQAAVVTPAAIDARRETAWRMKSLSLSIGEAGRMSAHDLLNGKDGKAYRIALSQNWGAALVDLAALTALADRLTAHVSSASGCNGQTAAAAQSAREAVALLDICRARAACPVGMSPREGHADRTLDGARAALAQVIPRAQAAGDVLSANLGPAAASGGNELAQAAAILNAGGVCQAGQSAQ
jgi:hypothetical protein